MICTVAGAVPVVSQRENPNSAPPENEPGAEAPVRVPRGIGTAGTSGPLTRIVGAIALVMPIPSRCYSEPHMRLVGQVLRQLRADQFHDPGDRRRGGGNRDERGVRVRR